MTKKNKSPKGNEQNYYKVTANERIIMTSSIPIQNVNFQKIILFYLFECPVRTVARIERKKPDGGSRVREYKNVSKMGKTFKERGLDGANLHTLRAAMKRVTTDITIKAIQNNVTDDDIPDSDEYIIIRKNDESVAVTEGYFYCIRNALAHGDFRIIGDYYYFKNAGRHSMNGIAKLKEKTLLKWIELVDMTVDELKRVGDESTFIL